MPLFFPAIRRILPSPQQQNWGQRSRFWLLLVCIVSAGVPVWGQTPCVLTGQVVDGRTGAPLERVLIVIEDTGQSALTGADGRFAISAVSAGSHRLYVSVVGYALFRKDVIVGSDPALPLTLRLGEGTSAYTESVTVTADPFRAPADPVASASVIGSADL